MTSSYHKFEIFQLCSENVNHYLIRNFNFFLHILIVVTEFINMAIIISSFGNVLI